MRLVIATVNCRICDNPILTETVPASSADRDVAREDANRFVRNKFKAVARQKGLAYKARTCSPECYGTLPNWNRILFRVFPVAAGWFQ